LSYREETYVCIRCFKDRYLLDLIQKNGHKGTCDFCHSRNVPISPVDDLAGLFRDVAVIYDPVDGFGGEFISYLLQEDWHLFSRKIEEAPDNLMQEIAVAILKSGLHPKHDVDYPEYSGFFRRRDFWLEEHWHSKAEAFIDSPEEVQKALLNFETEDHPEYSDYLAVAFEDLAVSYEPGHIFSRARIHEDRFRKDRIKLSEMGAPRPEDARAFRANRAKVPVLYLASDERTALAEVRAWKGAAVAIATMRTRRHLSLVSLLDLKLPRSPFLQESLEWKIQLGALFYRLQYELSQPVMPREVDSLYLSTQYLCDWVRHCGYDGIQFPSAMGRGYNVALFKTEDADPTEMKYIRVGQIHLPYRTFDRYEEPYEEGPYDYLFGNLHNS
jgi:hypothetical protein